MVIAPDPESHAWCTESEPIAPEEVVDVTFAMAHIWYPVRRNRHSTALLRLTRVLRSGATVSKRLLRCGIADIAKLSYTLSEPLQTSPNGNTCSALWKREQKQI